MELVSLTETERLSPHVVVLASTLVSHGVAILLLVRKLCRLGINVSFIGTESTIARFKAIGNESDENGRFRFVAVPNGEGYDPSEGYAETLSKLEERSSDSIAECLRGLMAGSQGWAAPCCAILDSFLSWVIKLTAPLMRSYFIWTSTGASAASMLHSPSLHAQGHIPVDFAHADTLTPVEVPCIGRIHPLEFIASMQTAGFMHNMFQETSRYILQMASGLIVNSVYEFEPSVFDALNEYYHVGAPSSKLESIIPVGPLLPESFFAEEPTVVAVKRDPTLEWLDKQPHSSVLYICFGTVATDLTAAHLVELGLGLEASDQRFIWVVRATADVSLIEFPDNLLPGFAERIQDRGVIVTRWAPQVQILRHPATGGFLTHCGWSSIAESVSGKVPMLAWPLMAEQRMNARWLVDEAGAALRVRNGFETSVTREQVENAVRRLMCGEEGQVLKQNVLRLHELFIQKGAGASGSSSRNIQAFADKLQQWNHHTASEPQLL